MRIRIVDTTPHQLNYLMAMCEGYAYYQSCDGSQMLARGDKRMYLSRYHGSTSWMILGPLVVKHKLDSVWNGDAEWWSVAGYDERAQCEVVMRHASYLTAAARCVIACTAGSEVDIPEEIQ